ncbi:acyltransferase family protein [Plantactinospora sp. GCM10030261]|uniref:acyltransferase family protein n=1 Tax=Plantactinospora sp. GCM10030261 TaxID=3273420 RepID=UPI003622D24D
MTVDTAAPPVGRADQSAPAAPPRDSYLDLWRAAALVRVVVYHVFGWIWLTVLFPAMGLMFALAGSLMAGSLDRTGSSAVRRRLRRLLPPMWAFAVIALPLLLLTGWNGAPATPLHWGELVWWLFPARTPPVGGQSWAWAFNVVLWYLVTYLWLVLLSPALLAAFRRWPWRTMALALALPVLARFEIVQLGGYLAEQFTNVASYLACWLLGFAHHDGLLRRIPARRYATAVVALAVAGAGWIVVFGATTGTWDVNRVHGGNTLWSVAFVATVLRFRPTLAWLHRVRPVARTVHLLNARAVTVYLWHLPAGMLAALLLTPVDTHNYAANVVLRLLVVVALTALPVLALGWVEDVAARRRPRLLPVPPARRAPAPGPRPTTARRPNPAVLPVPAPAPAPARAVPATEKTAPDRNPASVRRPGRSSGNRWHRAMVATVLVIAVGLAGGALHLIPGLPRPPGPAATGAQAATPRYLSDQVLLLDDAAAPGLVPLEGTAPGAEATEPGTARKAAAVVTRTPSRIRVHPPAGCERLRAVTEVGQADDLAQVRFAVQADGATVFDSGARTRDDGPEQVDIPLSGATAAVDLVATSTAGAASAVWADAHFLCAE